MPIWRDKGSWRYQFQFKGKRHSKQGFISREEAAEAMALYRAYLKLLIRREDIQSLIDWIDAVAADGKVTLPLPLGYSRIKQALERLKF